ncbi:MAG: hypothetical protein ABIG89_00080 [Candidatus Woesearchaeota archaeon]
MDRLNKLKKNTKKDFEDHIEVDEDSDLPVHEKFTKEKKIKE